MRQRKPRYNYHTLNHDRQRVTEREWDGVMQKERRGGGGRRREVQL